MQYFQKHYGMFTDGKASECLRMLGGPVRIIDKRKNPQVRFSYQKDCSSLTVSKNRFFTKSFGRYGKFSHLFSIAISEEKDNINDKGKHHEKTRRTWFCDYNGSTFTAHNELYFLIIKTLLRKATLFLR